MPTQSSQSTNQRSSVGDSVQSTSSRAQSNAVSNGSINHAPQFIQPGSSTASDKQDITDANSSRTRFSSNQFPAFTSSDNTPGTDDRTGSHAVLDDRSGQATASPHQSTNISTSSGSGHTPSSKPASRADAPTVKFSSSDLSQSKVSHASTGDGDAPFFTSASAGDTHNSKTGPAHDWSAGEITWAVEFARKAVGSLVQGRTHAVDEGHGGILKQAGGDRTQVFSLWSGKAGSEGNSARTDGWTSDHAGKTSLTSSGTIDHASTEHAQAADFHQGHGLTGFEI